MTRNEIMGVAQRPRILIVDDEPNIRAALLRLFRLEGFDTAEADSGPAALAALENACYDLMILDLILPGMNGSEVMRRARALDPNLQIIVLTGHATLDSAVAAVKLKAVDYLQKPAGLHEIASIAQRALQRRRDELERRHLLAVIGEAVEVLRKSEVAEAEQPYQPAAGGVPAPYLILAGGDRRQLVLPGEPQRAVLLTEGEMAILEILMSQPGRVFSCREIVRKAWDADVEEGEAQNMVRPHVFRLRHKMESDPDNPRWIKTVRGRGYLFATAN